MQSRARASSCAATESRRQSTEWADAGWENRGLAMVGGDGSCCVRTGAEERTQGFFIASLVRVQPPLRPVSGSCV